MLTDIDGILVGHWTQPEARTGCTVIVLPPGTTASGEVRGGAPATREFALLDPTKTVSQVDAVTLCGGSAFGLAAADGVMGWLEDQGRGFETKVGPVPIVVAMSLFDLAVGDGSVRPGADEGRWAATEASSGPHGVGLIGAGTGATVGKWLGSDHARPGGIGAATLRADELIVSALIAVNAVGMIDDGTSTADPGPPARATDLDPSVATDSPAPDIGQAPDPSRESTTIGVVATNANLDKMGCHLAAQSAHDGLARALLPAHTAADGDAFVAAATGKVDADLTYVRVLVQQVVAAAVRSLA
ncbi:MAG: P1 family peptidase [Actinomycetia bacterium]|nr:P1 family peptidase [Actinomycetes bacterium]